MAPESNHVSLQNATYSLTADAGQLATQARLLTTSLRQTCPNANVLTFVPEDSIDEIADPILQDIKANSTVVTGEIPLPEYPISAKQQALRKAVQQFDTDYYVGLDTDTVILSPPVLESSSAELYASPVFVGTQYWASEYSEADWHRLYDAYDLSPPSATVQTSCDNRTIRPYFNAGVIVTSDKDFPDDWLSITRDTLNAEFLEHDETFFNDQIALALAARNRKTELLSDQQNFPLLGRIHCPDDVQILHYGKWKNLSRIRNPTIATMLRQYGWEPQTLSMTDWSSMALDLISAHSGRVVPYPVRSRLHQAARTALPNRLYQGT